MNKFYDDFIANILENKFKSLGITTNEFFSSVNSYKDFLFVEGDDDIPFYSAVLRNQIQKEDTYFISCGGKPNVIKMFKYLEKNNYAMSKRKYFLVDKDFTGLDNCEEIIKNKFNVTKYYSIENYFFEEQNLMKVLKECKIYKLESKFILEKLKKYTEEILEYEAMVATKIENNYIKDKILDDNKKLSDYIYINANKELVLSSSIKLRIGEIKKQFNKKKKQTFNKWKKELEANYLYMKGHDLQLFFDKIMVIYKKEEELKNFILNEEFVSTLYIDYLLK